MIGITLHDDANPALYCNFIGKTLSASLSSHNLPFFRMYSTSFVRLQTSTTTSTTIPSDQLENTANSKTSSHVKISFKLFTITPSNLFRTRSKCTSHVAKDLPMICSSSIKPSSQLVNLSSHSQIIARRQS